MVPLVRLTMLVACAALWLGTARPAAAQDPACETTAELWSAAAAQNAVNVFEMQWEPFGRETGWLAYLPMTQQELGTTCGPETADFAAAMAAFQARYALEADGVFGSGTFQVLKGLWQERRPFVMARVRGECPHAPERYELAEFDRTEESARRPGRMGHAVMIEAYRAMVAEARASVPEIAADPELLTVFSTYRHPDIDGVRCEDEGNCDGRARAACSAHRTGWAIDINVGLAEGYGVSSTNAVNRRVQSQGPAYRWLVANAARFGFVNYIYEPWHWEYIGPGATYAP